jgi:hypothetical protein
VRFAKQCSNCTQLDLTRAMGTLISFLVHPFSTARRFRNQYDEDGSLGDLIYHATLFFAFGIYTVIRRHLNARSRAKPFRVEPPEVWLSLTDSFTRLTLFQSCSKLIRRGQMRQQSPTPLLSPTNTMETLRPRPEKSLVGTMSLVSILLPAFIWAHFLRTTSMK